MDLHAPAYLHLSRHRVFYLRWPLPKALQPSTVKVSLETAEALLFLATQGIDVNWVLTGEMTRLSQHAATDAPSSIVVSAKDRTRADPGELMIDILTPLLRQTVEDAKRVDDIDWLATATKFAMQYALKYAEFLRR